MKIPFNVDAFTARLIGRENVAKLDGAILELVKNSYDADASICILYFEKSTNTFYLMDNGCGMEYNTIISNWMTIGYSSKKSNYKLASGRIQTGAKGIGRFALDRIADMCTMLSKSGDSSILWNVDWRDFNIGKKITDVGAEIQDTNENFNDFIKNIKNQNLKVFVEQKFKNTGTIFKLSLLHDEWDETLTSQIKKGLTTLIPPQLANFKLYVFTEINDLKDAYINIDDGFHSYDYKINFSVNEIGNVNIKIYRNEFDFGKKLDEIIKTTSLTEKDKEYFLGKPIEKNVKISDTVSGLTIDRIGPFNGTFYFNKLSMTKADREIYFYKDITGCKDLRSTFGGIKIYRDNFRVRPYGEPNTTASDWLMLSARNRRSLAAPSSKTGAWRVSAEQMMGAVHISRLNINLPDQSNREGIVETKEFGLFREFLIYVIKEMEQDRQYVARILKDYYEITHPADVYEEEILKKAKKSKNINKNLKTNTPHDSTGQDNENFNIDVEKAEQVLNKKNDEINDLKNETHMLRVLATTGIITNTYVHEIKDATNRLRTKIITIKNAIDKDKPIEHIYEHVKEALKLQEALNSWFKVTIDMVKKDKRTRTLVSLKTHFESIITSWESILSAKNICLKSDIVDIRFKCFPYDIESIISNLIANSIKSFENTKIESPEIKITIKVQNNIVLIDYSDNGKGLDAKYKSNPNLILEPLETSSRNSQGELIGTGMGMWIVNKTIGEYKGEMDLSKNMETTNGFFALIKLHGEIRYD